MEATSNIDNSPEIVTSTEAVEKPAYIKRPRINPMAMQDPRDIPGNIVSTVRNPQREGYNSGNNSQAKERQNNQNPSRNNTQTNYSRPIETPPERTPYDRNDTSRGKNKHTSHANQHQKFIQGVRNQEHKFSPGTSKTTYSNDRQAPRPFQGGSRNIKNEVLGAGASFVSIPKFRNKKSFPFLTPQQAVKKFLYEFHEETPTPIGKETLRIIPFGGVEQVGLNCIGFEYEDEVLIVDAGIQFSDPYQHGINGTIPDLSYVRDKKVVGICITHGHIDHIGAMPHFAEQFGRNIPVWATPMAYELIALRQNENNATLTNMHEYRRNETIQIGKYFQVMPFTVDHSIPDSVGLLIETPVGRFIHTGDWKFDKNPLPYRPSTDYNLLESIGNRGVRALLSDSTNAHLSGSSISESEIVRSMEDIFEDATGRVITATFSSIIDRVALIIATAEKYNRKVVLMGRSMNNYLEIAFKLGYTRPKTGTIISMEQAKRLPDNQVCICCTGAQGERYAAMMRMATGEHKDTVLKPTDTVVFSSSVIPGNERAVQLIFDIIMAQGPTIKHYRESEVHAGGHARQEDTEKMISLIKPEVYVPIYGYPHMLYGNAKNAYKMGYDKEHVLISRNGQIMEFTKNSFRITHMFAPHAIKSVDGYTTGYTNEVHLHDRYQMELNGSVAVSFAPV